MCLWTVQLCQQDIVICIFTMPRKRHTKVVNRKDPELPDDSIVEAQMDESSRNSKLDLLLWDFDRGVEDHIKKRDTALTDTIASIQCMYKVEMMKIPSAQLNMLWKEYQQCSGNEHLPLSAAVNDVITAAAAQSCVSEVDTELAKSRKNRGRQSKQKQTQRKPDKQKKTPQVTEAENSDDDNLSSHSTSTVSRSTRTRAATAFAGKQSASSRSRTKTALNDSQVSNMEPLIATEPKTRRARRAKFMTPAVTPKWDPRTPATVSRCARPGELVMSLKGSPVTVGPPNRVSKVTAVVPLTHGMTLAINENTDMSTVPYPDLDSITRAKLEKLQKNISVLLIPRSESH